MPARSNASARSKTPFPTGTKVKVNYEYGDGTAHFLVGTIVATADDRFLTINPGNNDLMSISIARIFWVASA